MLNIKQEKFKNGFGLLEVLVSSVIIITILSALVFVGRTALANSVYTEQRAQATYLAQEGIEMVRQIRDTNWIDGLNTTQWDTLQWSDPTTRTVLNSVFPMATPPTDFDIVYGTGAMSSRIGLKPLVSPAVPTAITINQTSYTRTVNVSAVGSLLPKDASNLSATDVNSANNALKITVTVSFDNVTGNKEVSVNEVITNWRPNY